MAMLTKATIDRYAQGLAGLRSILAVLQDAPAADVSHMLAARLIADMKPLSFQVEAVLFHSVRSLEMAMDGEVTPPVGDGIFTTLPEILAAIDTAEAALKAISEQQMEQLFSREIAFRAGPMTAYFTGIDYFLSFSLPNFYFHLTTAYNILRQAGYSLSKIDFIGPLNARIEQ